MKTLSEYLICEGKVKYFMDYDYPSRTACACFDGKTLAQVKDIITTSLGATSLAQYGTYEATMNAVEKGIWDESIVKDVYAKEFNANGATLDKVLINADYGPNEIIGVHMVMGFARKNDIKTEEPLDGITLNFVLYDMNKKDKKREIEKVFKQELKVNISEVDVMVKDTTEVGSSVEADIVRSHKKSGKKVPPMYEFSVSVEMPFDQFKKAFNL